MIKGGIDVNLLFRCILAAGLTAASAVAAEAAEAKDRWQPLPARPTAGILRASLDAWRSKHLWRVAADPTVLGVFEREIDQKFWDVLKSDIPEPEVSVLYDRGEFRFTRTGEKRGNLDPQGGAMGSNRLRYHGEHIGKWLDAGALACDATQDQKTRQALADAAGRLVRSLKPDGYLGGYPPGRRFYDLPDPYAAISWDVWNARYVLLGLLSHEQFHPDPVVLNACTRLGDLLVKTFGAGAHSIAESGQWDGLAAATLVESAVMLYSRTREERFLRFAEHLVESAERVPKLRTLSTLLEGKGVTESGQGKAYELMSNLLGYVELYRWTGKALYLQGAVAAWERIRRDHLLEAGGPWSSKFSPGGLECFADPKLFDPGNVVETCSTATWIQLSLSLLRVTGEARYAEEAERAFVNQLLGAQSPDGVSWATHPPANGTSREFSTRLSCCASNGPRALEMFARHLAGLSSGAVSIASYLPFRGAIPAGEVTVSGGYPFSGDAQIRFDLRQPAEFAVDLRLPPGARSMRVSIAGRRQKLVAQPFGFLRLQRRWTSGDTVVMHAEFPIQRNVHPDRHGNRWVVYTQGPVVLARTVKDSREFSQGPLPRPAELIPYYQAGREGGGYQSYFQSAEKVKSKQ